MHSYFLFLIFGIYICLPAFPRSEQVSHIPQHWPIDRGGSLKLPGISLNPVDRFIDINATVCLDIGLLELVACTKNTKEHESIVVLNARPMHIHAALLLLKAKPGRPAMQKVIDNENLRWVPVTPTGEQIEVSLVFKDNKGKIEEFPISTFVSPTKLNEFEGFEVDEKFSLFRKLFFSLVPIFLKKKRICQENMPVNTAVT